MSALIRLWLTMQARLAEPGRFGRGRGLSLWVVGGGLALLLVAEAAEARVGGGSSYSGSRRSGGSSGGGSYSGGSSGGGAALFYLFTLLPWPLQIVLAIAIIIVFFRLKSRGATLSYGGLDIDGDIESDRGPFVPFGGPQGRSGPGAGYPGHRYAEALPPSWGERGRRLDPAFSEVLFLERAVMMMTRLFEAGARRADLEAMAPYVAPAAAQTLAQRSAGVVTVRGVTVGRIALIEVAASTTEGGEPAVAVRARVQLNRHVEQANGPLSFYSHEEWSFVRAVAAAPRDEAHLDRFGCPGCGSPLERDSFGRCVHCQTSLLPGAADWSVRSLRVLEEERRGPLLTTTVEEVGTDAPTAKDNDVAAQVERWLPGPEAERFRVRAGEIFVNLQSAWTRRDLGGLRPFETDSLWQSHRFWIEEYQRQDLRNVIDAVAVRNIELCRVERDGDHLAVMCRIHASCVDYVIEDKTKKRLSGSTVKRRAFTEYWTFVKHHDAQGGTGLKTCPGCGAQLRIGAAGTCEYCQSKVTLGRFDWVASRIEQDEEIVPG